MGLWLTDIDIVIVEGGSAQEAQGRCPAGYTLIPPSTSTSAGGRWIYLCYYNGSDAIDNGENIITIAMCFNKHPWHHGQTVKVDLNKGTSGGYVYLAYVKRKLTAGTTSITRTPWNQWYLLGNPISELKVLDGYPSTANRLPRRPSGRVSRDTSSPLIPHRFGSYHRRSRHKPRNQQRRPHLPVLPPRQQAAGEAAQFLNASQRDGVTGDTGSWNILPCTYPDYRVYLT